MRSLLIIILLLVVILVGAPYVDGLMFKRIFMEQVARQQARLQTKNFNLEVIEYNQGWFTSTAKMKTTYKLQSPRLPIAPQIVYVDSVIHHGPMIINPKTNTPTMAYGLIQTNIHLPDALKVFVPDSGDGYLHITSIVSFDGKTWRNHYVADPLDILGRFKWEGLTGNNVIYYAANRPMTIKSDNRFGAVTLSDPANPKIPDVNIQAITFNFDANERQRYLWDGSAKIIEPGFLIKYQDGRLVELNKLELTYNYGMQGEDFYSYKLLTTYDRLKVLNGFPITDISAFTHELVINNLNAKGLQNFVEEVRQSPKPSKEVLKAALPNVIDPTTQVQTKFSANTNLGAASGSLNINFTAVPQVNESWDKVMNMTLNGRAAINLVEALVTYSIQQKQPNVDAQAQMRTMVDGWLAQGHIVKENNDYVIVFVKQGDVYTVNGKDVTALIKAGQSETDDIPAPTVPLTEPGPVQPQQTPVVQ